MLIMQQLSRLIDGDVIYSRAKRVKIPSVDYADALYMESVKATGNTTWESSNEIRLNKTTLNGSTCNCAYLLTS